ncbi:MAG: YggT family protein [Paraglaciecola sp.]|uniref:YggT family protein n=1 Tax=Paraglaciecola sp. TaxID=1920173 RepID=UPI00273FE192|nr:YggT family protein [Paraglaciecola sp.]MDP5032889.1 YggT family protein [Paraglaciecola sp.]MDP5041472.1 YggT family protein [Paraglaciecola sp.]MDP5132811.1 YggT family protein [Paraglaciecola sp.]
MSSIDFLISLPFKLYLMVVLLRFWLQLSRADFYNPFSQFIVKATHPIIGPLRRVVPSMGRFDTATLLLAWLVAIAKIVVLSLLAGYALTNFVGIGLAGLLIVFSEAIDLVIYVLILRAIMSWVSQGRNPMELVLAQLTEPMLAPIRKRMPDLGGLDLSVMVVILLLIFLQKLMGDLFGAF